MSREPEHAVDSSDSHGSLLVLALLALIVGAFAGLIGAVFRLSLEHADRLRGALIAWAHGERFVGYLCVTLACAAAALVAAWPVRRFSPHASGSGIPYVEAVLHGELPQADGPPNCTPDWSVPPSERLHGSRQIWLAVAIRSHSARWQVPKLLLCFRLFF
jgi:H+/Cl- antiporter ClcA